MAAWLRAAQDLASPSQDVEAKEVVRLIAERAVLAVVRPSDGIAYLPRRGVNSSEALHIVSVLRSDVWLLPRDDHYRMYTTDENMRQRGNFKGEFHTPTHGIYLPGEWPRAKECQGLSLLHEGLYAYDVMVRRRHMPRPFRRRERNARLLVLRVLQGIGGQRFAGYIDLMIPVVAQQYDERDLSRPFVFIRPVEFTADTLLDKVLWRTVSPGDHFERMSGSMR